MQIDKINFKGFIDGDTGYSILSRALISLMDYRGMDIRVENLHPTPLPQFKHLMTKDNKDRFQLLHQIPTVAPESDGFYTVTEFDQPPYGSISPMRNAKLILTESNFCKKVFQEFTKAEIHVIHLPIDPQLKPGGIQYKLADQIEKFRFKFLAVFEWIMRKDPYTLISAFCEEFKPEEDVCLILRTWSKFVNPRKWIGVISKGHNVFWMPEQVPNIGALYRTCDCLVSTTLGEGFGHPIAEAMACGLKVIVPKSTGMLDFCNTKNAIMVPTEEMTIKEFQKDMKIHNEIPHLIKPWFTCWRPKKEALMKAMRKAYTNEMKFIKDNAVKIRDKYSIENILQEMEVAFSE